MTTYTIQVGFGSWDVATVVVEAESVEEACRKAVEGADEDPVWSASEYQTPISVDKIAEGEFEDPYYAGAPNVEVPFAFTEAGVLLDPQQRKLLEHQDQVLETLSAIVASAANPQNVIRLASDLLKELKS